MPANATVRVLKNTAAFAAAKVSVPLFSLVFLIYIARKLGVTDFGKFVLVQTYFQLFLSLCTTALSTVVTREIAKTPDRVNLYLSASNILVIVLTLVANGLLIITAQMSHYAADTKAAVYLAGLALLPASVSYMYQAVFMAFEKAKFITYGTLLENTLRIGVGLLVLYLGFGVLGIFVAFIITHVVSLLFFYLAMNRSITKPRWDFDWTLLKQLVRSWTVFAVENWLFILFHRLDVILLSFFYGELAVGVYGAASKILNPGSVLSSSFVSALFPYMSRLFEESREKFQRVAEDVFKYLLITTLLGAFTIAILADQIIPLLFTDIYAEAIPVLQILILTTIPTFLNSHLSYSLFARGEQKKALWVAVLSLTFYVSISPWMIARWAAIGAAWALVLALGTAFCFYFGFVFKQERTLHMLLMFGRTILAGISVGVFILFFKSIHLIPLLSLAMILYIFFLFILKVPSPSEVKLMQRIARGGLAWLRSRA